MNGQAMRNAVRFEKIIDGTYGYTGCIHYSEQHNEPSESLCLQAVSVIRSYIVKGTRQEQDKGKK